MDALRLRARDIRHPFHGVSSSGIPNGIRELCAAYLPVMPDGAYFSHETAAALLGVPLPPDVQPYPLHVAVARPRTAPRGRGIVGHSLGNLTGAVVDGIPVSVPAHAWCQLSGRVGRGDLVAAGDHFVGARSRPSLVTVDELAAVSARSARTKGASTRAWALPRIRFGADSRPETLLRLYLEAQGWDELDVNPPLLVDSGLVTIHPDLASVRGRVVFEYEGDGHRVDRWQWHHDIERRELLEEAGWRVIRVTSLDLFQDNAAFARRLQRFAPNVGKRDD
ncbi:hypothetical protein [Leifsonia sp. NPDC080035]|uniref:DUF559 domain-containing protein n=1 Tax=Leifsonia sp. NPDC080035 TaxID=3143936 RepID=A0AAU7GB09_9MICO